MSGSGYTLQQYKNLYCITFFGSVTPAQTDAVFGFMDVTVMARNEPYAWISSLNDANIPASVRARWSKYLASHEAYVGRYNVASPYVAPSRVAQGMLTAFHWIFTPPYPTAVFRSLDDAVAWVLPSLEKAKLARGTLSSYRAGLSEAAIIFDNRVPEATR